MKFTSFVSWSLTAMPIMAVRLNFTMSVSPPPQPGSKFEITWAPVQGGRVSILLNNFLDSAPTLPIITTSSTIATVNDTGSYVWTVPTTLCGRHSVSLSYQFERIAAYSQIWTGTACAAAPPTTVYQTTACLPTSSSGAGSVFKMPNMSRYPYRSGQKSWISWVPPENMDTISLYIEQEKTLSRTTIADNIPNSGFFEWTPDSSLNVVNDIMGTLKSNPYSIVLSNSQGSRSPSFFVLSGGYPSVLINRTSWNTPTIGQPNTFLWSPSNEPTISFQLVFGAGAVPGPSNTIMIAQKVPNTGSFTWNVPNDFTPGQYILNSFSGTTGVQGPELESIIVGRVPPVACANSASSPSFRSSTTQVPASETLSTRSSPSYAQILGVTTCPSSLSLFYASTTLASTRTVFLTVGCSSTPDAVATQSSNPSASCFPDYARYTQDSTLTFCCPSSWQTSTIGNVWCFTSLNDVAPVRNTTERRRLFSDGIPSQTMNENQRTTSVGGGGGGGGLDGTSRQDIWGWATSSSIPEKVISNLVFVRAGVVTRNSTTASAGGSAGAGASSGGGNKKSEGSKMQNSEVFLMISAILGISTGILMLAL